MQWLVIKGNIPEPPFLSICYQSTFASSFKNFAVGPSSSMIAHFKNALAPCSTVFSPLNWFKSVAVYLSHKDEIWINWQPSIY